MEKKQKKRRLRKDRIGTLLFEKGSIFKYWFLPENGPGNWTKQFFVFRISISQKNNNLCSAYRVSRDLLSDTFLTGL